MAFGDNPVIPIFEPAARPTGYCTATVRGGRVVRASASPTGGMFGTENINVAECNGASQVPIAIAVYEGATGDQIPLIGLRSGLIVPIPAGAAISAPGLVMADSQGRVIPYVGPTTTTATALPAFPQIVGVALETAALADDLVAVWLG